MERDLDALLRFFVQVSCQALLFCLCRALCLCADQVGCQLRATLQITKETPTAHVILATSRLQLSHMAASK